MCTRPLSALLYREHGSLKWSSKFYPDTMLDEMRGDLAMLKNRAFFEFPASKYERRFTRIPCQQCLECRLARSRVWANRAVIEAEQYPAVGNVRFNWFVTLTINPENIYLFDTPSGASLKSVLDGKKDLSQIFMHDLRQLFSLQRNHTGIRFLESGEYGNENQRPHFHFLLFNCPIHDNELVYFFTNEFGDPFYLWPPLAKLWPYGFTTVSECNWNTAAYTARYVVKKITGQMSDEFYGDRKPPFLRSSRRPGIGGSAFKGYATYAPEFDPGVITDLFNADTLEYDGLDDIVSELLHDKVYFDNVPKNRPAFFKPPRYYDKLMDDLDPVFLSSVKRVRSANADLAFAAAKKVRPMSDREMFQATENSLEQSFTGHYRHLLDIF